jgi:hypothetical protein
VANQKPGARAEGFEDAELERGADGYAHTPSWDEIKWSRPGPAAITLSGRITRMPGRSVVHVSFYRACRRMRRRSIVWSVAPDPGSWHFAIMAIVWQGFGVSFGPRTGGVQATGAFCDWVAKHTGNRVSISRSGISRRGPIIRLGS